IASSSLMYCSCLPFFTLYIGGMAFRQGKTQVNNAISVDAKDIEAFKKLNARGIELEARKVSTDPKLKMMDLIAKVDK
ncbi:PTS sugar transporter subunit IIB, partial [Klebsiella pneumoniae]